MNIILTGNGSDVLLFIFPQEADTSFVHQFVIYGYYATWD